MRTKGHLIYDLLIGRSMLMRAAKHLKDYARTMDLKCSLGVIYGEDKDHVGKWKAAGKEYGFDNCEDEKFEMIECPLCSACYATFGAKKIMAGRVGRINGILTRMGNGLREKQDDNI